MPVLKYPLATEKAISMIDRNNIITYIVDFRATKTEIKKEFESMFAVKVERINSVNTTTNLKKVYIKMAKGFKATDVASKMKLV
ncbi:MAG: 50S ribosomal protein L23 [Candidatus Micrarchaeales archaeon]